MPESVGWSVHKIHNKKNFIDFGQFQVPFYEHRLQLESVLQDYQKNVGPLRLCFSILPLDHEKEETPYKMADYYMIKNYVVPEIHTEERLSENLKKEVLQEVEQKNEIRDQRKREFYDNAIRELDSFSNVSSINASMPTFKEFEVNQRQTKGTLNSISNGSESIQSRPTLNQQEIDKFVRLSKDYEINPNEFLKSLHLIPQNKDITTILEENTMENSQYN